MAAQSIIIGCDSLGVELKEALKAHLTAKGHPVTDIGISAGESIDYPDIALTLATRMAAGEFDRGILVCGTGAGMAITANKVPGVRAVCVQDPYTAERAIASNDARVITFGQLITGAPNARMLTDIWLANSFQGGRSAPKVARMEAIDESFRKAG
jgi:ribose 5-phosphate isomerase B